MINTKLNQSKPLWLALGLGLVAGMRTMSAPAIGSIILSRRLGRGQGVSPGFLSSKVAATMFGLLAAGEFIGDKLPTAPDRINAFSLVARGVSGSISGACIYRAAGKAGLKGALLGGGAAILATYASYYGRKNLVKYSHIPDPFIGGAEDAVVLSLGCLLVAADK